MIGAGIYEAYSNQSAANVTFSFLGVAATYLAIKKSDRGLCMLTIDGESVSVYGISAQASAYTETN